MSETGSTSREQEAAPRASLPRAVRLQVAVFSAAIDVINRRDGTVNRRLYSVADRVLRVRAGPRPDPSGVRSADFDVDASRGLWARVFSFSSPVPQAPLPVVVYFHGGGFAMFSARQCYFDRLCRRICRGVGAVVVSVEYRLAPEHPYPAAYDDAVDTLRFIDANGVPGMDEGVRVDLSSCFLAGESAGGNIIHHAANRWAAAAPTPSSVRVAGLLSVQPYFGGEERTESELRLDGVAPIVTLRRADFWWRAFLPEGASRDHPAAHVTDENAELTEAFPPAMVLVGGLDPLQDWQRRYADVLRRKGKAVEVVEFPDGIHAFYLFPDLPDTARAIERMRTFVESNRQRS
ncbi:probable carboxylesterase 18 [Hordeum vulgare subsp. vulgare]|uniref:probable carboxylesterase 18 n=1 Tax=Hordeum vulgare subsp. vulgare TaxID=112509 RepID=UPI001D1A511A|nr:probable carboxylesterase 18 [Hordeum vulgare subsp. vulgare]